MSEFIWDVASRHWVLLFIDVSGQRSYSFFKSRMYNVNERSNLEEGKADIAEMVGTNRRVTRGTVLDSKCICVDKKTLAGRQIYLEIKN